MVFIGYHLDFLIGQHDKDMQVFRIPYTKNLFNYVTDTLLVDLTERSMYQLLNVLILEWDLGWKLNQ